MTFVTRPMTMHTNHPNRRGFTLLELLLVIGIIALLAGILLPAVTKAYARSVVLRTQADLQAIATGLEAYKADFGTYPVVTAANTGAAVLGKALVGPYDEAHYYDSNRNATTALNNPPAAFDNGKTYQAGDVVLNGAAPTYTSYTTGTPLPNLFIAIRGDNTGNTPKTAVAGGDLTDYYWAMFSPYDGQDGPGVRPRLAASADSAGLPHAAAGKVYGPYLDPERFKTNGSVLLDRYGSPILYFPVNKAANPRNSLIGPPVSPGWSTELEYPPAANRQSQVNLSDNLALFVNLQGTPSEATDRGPARARIRVIMGDYEANGLFDSGTDVEMQSLPFLLWTAGADKVFGPRGNGVAAAAAWKLHDVVTGGMNVDQNRLSAAACDDVTNFR